MTSIDTRPCPNCLEPADFMIETRPFEREYIQCNYCGLAIYPKIRYMSLKELNEIRKDSEMTMLKKLPKQNKNLF